eukprot:3498489-Pyramimonas_sp.AAC.1
MPLLLVIMPPSLGLGEACLCADAGEANMRSLERTPRQNQYASRHRPPHSHPLDDLEAGRAEGKEKRVVGADGRRGEEAGGEMN